VCAAWSTADWRGATWRRMIEEWSIHKVQRCTLCNCRISSGSGPHRFYMQSISFWNLMRNHCTISCSSMFCSSNNREGEWDQNPGSPAKKLDLPFFVGKNIFLFKNRYNCRILKTPDSSTIFFSLKCCVQSLQYVLYVLFFEQSRQGLGPSIPDLTRRN
jgi:hypothetical protein